MVSPFISPSSTPRGSRKSHVNKESKNPYSSRGLDKFSELLAELDEKRQKIYSKSDLEGAPLVRFVFTSSNECIPVVIKCKDRASHRKEKKSMVDQDSKDQAMTHKQKFSVESRTNSDKEMKQSEADPDKTPENTVCPLMNVDLHRMKRPSYYLPVTVILILMFLILFGRSFAILCTCIGWYMVPTIESRSSNGKISMKKKNYVRRLSGNENKGSFNPRTRDHAAMKEKSPPRLCAHRKS